MPGFDVNPPPQVHPSYFFEHKFLKEGDSLVKEGDVLEPTIWAIRHGEVTLTRNQWVKRAKKDTMGDGDVFSSMSAVPFLSAEPFNVVVSSTKCEVYILHRMHFEEIQDSVMSQLRKHLRQDTMKRVKALCIKSAAGRDAMQSPRAESFPDWREAPATAPVSAIIPRSQSQPALVSPKSTSKAEVEPASPTSPKSSTFVTE